MVVEVSVLSQTVPGSLLKLGLGRPVKILKSNFVRCPHRRSRAFLPATLLPQDQGSLLSSHTSRVLGPKPRPRNAFRQFHPNHFAATDAAVQVGWRISSIRSPQEYSIQRSCRFLLSYNSDASRPTVRNRAGLSYCFYIVFFGINHGGGEEGIRTLDTR